MSSNYATSTPRTRLTRRWQSNSKAPADRPAGVADRVQLDQEPVPRRSICRNIPDVKGAAICIAIVDDEASVRTMLGRLLRLADYEVAAFSCGEEFISSLAMRRPDCVILDVHRPGPSGCNRHRSPSPRGSVPDIRRLPQDHGPG
jgi:Response regulator receiver domain